MKQMLQQLAVEMSSWETMLVPAMATVLLTRWLKGCCGLQEKLAGGIEDGVRLSVSGQVNALIQEATDPANLCQLFPGWQPWV